MNHALPPVRDVPPRSRARIRARLEDEVAGRRRPARRFAPLIVTGAATAAVIALVTVVAPWGQPGGADAADPSSRSAYPTTAPPRTYSTAERPVITGVSPERIAEIERGCASSVGVGGGGKEGEPVLHQLLTDAVGGFALVYTDHAALSCFLDSPGPAGPYNASLTSGLQVEWLPGEFAVDSLGRTGGDQARPGYELAAGRVTSKVARVTFTWGERTVDAVIANGTFVARIPQPPEAPGPDGVIGDVRAYDDQDNLLGSWLSIPDERCYARPDHVIVAGNAHADPTTCWPAVLWRL